jgi:formate hydrogenlyase subunit 6/NADH:ubiquinone oxidoreductase subunit I
MGGAPAAFVLDKNGLGKLIEALRQGGYRVIGPTVRDGAIVYDEIAAVDDLPAGKTDEQSGGKYRLRDRSDGALFGYAVGPDSWKRLLHPPRVRLFRAERRGAGFDVVEEPQDPPRWAFFGVRPCELAAIAVQDRVFLGGTYVDPTYHARRERSLIIAANCGSPSATCFCASMQTGPHATAGYDLALTETLAEGRHEFLVDVGTRRGGEILAGLEPRAAKDADRRAAADICADAAGRMGRHLDTRGVRELLHRNSENARWDEVATRCLACANCTMVCPTCFCTTVEDSADLPGHTAERWRKWDSCFTTEFSYIHGGAIRTSGRARYRQWLTHKLASWHDQFGTSGCVGCGRCITWCPVGIDLTAEVEAIRAADTPDRVVRGGA